MRRFTLLFFLASAIIQAASLDDSPEFDIGEKIRWTVDLSTEYQFGVYCSRMEAFLAPATTNLQSHTKPNSQITSARLNEFIDHLRKSIVLMGNQQPLVRDNARLILSAILSESHLPLEMIGATNTRDPIYGDPEASMQVEVGTRYQVVWTARKPRFELYQLHLACVSPRELRYPIIKDLDLRWFLAPMRRELVASSQPFRIKTRSRRPLQQSSSTKKGMSQFDCGDSVNDLTPPELYLRALGHSMRHTKTLESLLEELMVLHGDQSATGYKRMEAAIGESGIQFPDDTRWCSIIKQLRAKLRKFRSMHQQLRAISAPWIEQLARQSELTTERIYPPTAAAIILSSSLSMENSPQSDSGEYFSRVCPLPPVEFNLEALQRVMTLLALRLRQRETERHLSKLIKYRSVAYVLRTLAPRAAACGALFSLGNRLFQTPTHRFSAQRLGGGALALYFALIIRSAYLEQLNLADHISSESDRQLVAERGRLDAEIAQLSADNCRYFAVQTVKSLCRLMQTSFGESNGD